MGSNVPGIDAGARQRLTARFGSEVEAWFDQLPGVLTALGERWRLQLGAPIPRGACRPSTAAGWLTGGAPS